jgi:UDP-3-O-[3-hydroxymyristoyl] glucosamine N-acyltransferase
MSEIAIGETMGDARFFARSGPYCLADIAAAANGVAGPISAGRVFTGVSPLQTATSDQVSFLDNRRYAAALDATHAGAVIVHPAMAGRVPACSVPIVTPDTYEGWARVARLFHPLPACTPGIHPSSVVAPSAIIHETAEIGPFCVIGDAAEIGAFCRIGPYVSIGAGVSLGADCRIGSHASLSHAVVGERVYIYPGARIGQEGFSFANTKLGFLSIPQLGRVVIGDDVEVGANTTIDRGSVRDTVIGAGSRLDNLVQIGHNVQMGRCCVIVAQVGISGSTVLEDFVQVGGQAAMAGHLRIGRGAQIGAQAGVIADAAPGAILLGSPAQSRHSFLRGVAMVKRLTTRPGV